MGVIKFAMSVGLGAIFFAKEGTSDYSNIITLNEKYIPRTVRVSDTLGGYLVHGDNLYDKINKQFNISTCVLPNGYIWN